MDTLHPDSEVIDRLGGPVEVARLCEISSQAVSQWRRAGIPQARRQYLRLLRPVAFDTGVPSPSAQHEVRDAA